MSNASIGSRIRAMDDANDLIVDIEGSWPVTSGMIQGGGGETAIAETNQPQPPEDCDTAVTRINITINTFLFQQFAAAGADASRCLLTVRNPASVFQMCATLGARLC